MGLQDAAVIDVHAHVVIAETMGAAGSFGPEIGQHPDGMPWFRVGSYRLDGVRYVGGNWEHILAKVQRFQGVIVGSVLVLLLGAWLYRRFFKSRNLPP